jgi:DNA helicase IV
MYNRKRIKKNGKCIPLRGARLERKKKFEPTIATASGVEVRSLYEKRCADFLFDNNIKFKYEPLILLDGKQYRPDFFLPDFNLFIEICGYGHMPYYNERLKLKERLYEKHNLQVLFIHYNGRGSLEKKIRESLEKHGIDLPIY